MPTPSTPAAVKYWKRWKKHWNSRRKQCLCLRGIAKVRQYVVGHDIVCAAKGTAKHGRKQSAILSFAFGPGLTVEGMVLKTQLS
jgi:hypothetical protein